MTPLATARADATICRAATRALRRGDGPESVAAFLCTYAGLSLPSEYERGGYDGYMNGYDIGYATAEAMIRPEIDYPVATLPGRERKRWWAR